jgi:hypothetical protein
MERKPQYGLASHSARTKRASYPAPSAENIQFMKIANHSFGYGANDCGFKLGTSPTLGKTIIIDPGATANYGVYKNKAAKAFITVHDQIKAGGDRTHTIESGANMLATHAFMQKLYTEQGLSFWGAWSVGCNETSFNIYKGATNTHENQFLLKAQQLIDPHAHNTSVRINTSSGLISDIKIRNNPQHYTVLSALQEKLTQSLDICANPNTPLQTVKNKLALIR